MKKTISLLFALCTLAIAVIPVNAVERHRSIELMRYSNISDVWAGYSEANLIGTCSGYLLTISRALRMTWQAENI